MILHHRPSRLRLELQHNYGTKFKPQWSKISRLSLKATLIQCIASTTVYVEGTLAVVIKELQVLKGMKNLCHILIKRQVWLQRLSYEYGIFTYWVYGG